MAYVLDSIPIGLLSVLTFLITLASFEGGFRIGRRAKREGEAPFGTVVGAGLGLLAFFLAFTFGMAASRFEARRQLVLDEANAIGTAHLRAALVPEPHRAAIRSLLREYLDARIQGVQSGTLEPALARSEELHRLLWGEVVALGQADPHSIVAGLLIESINEVIDLHETRVTAGLRSRIPERVWDVLFLLTVVSMMASGYQAAHAPGRSLTVVLIALAFSSVILVIADLDRPLEGSLRVSQQALIDTRESMDR